MRNIIKFLILAIVIFSVFAFISVKTQKEKFRTLEPQKITSESYISAIKEGLNYPSVIELGLGREVSYSADASAKADALIKLEEFREVKEISIPGNGRFTAEENSKILWFKIKIKRLFGEYTNHIVNAGSISGVACDKDFKECYILDVKQRYPEKGVITGEGERDFYVAGSIPEDAKIDLIVFYYTFYAPTYIGGAVPTASSVFAKFVP